MTISRSDLDRLREEYASLDALYRGHNAERWNPLDAGFANGIDVSTAKADALIAALEAELERLRCCGNCGRFVIDCDDLETYCPNGDGTFTRCYIQDHCHFTPSRWKEAER